MSEFRCPVIEIGKFGKHSGADSLSILSVDGVPCIFRTGDFQEGDKAVYIPLDAMVPLDNPAFSFLEPEAVGKGKLKRLKAKKLRGKYSEGLLIPVKNIILDGVDTLSIGVDLAGAMGIKKFVEVIPACLSGEQESNPGITPVYDMESWDKYGDLLIEGEDVVITEKLHGCNSLYMVHDDLDEEHPGHNEKFYVGTHHTFQKDTKETAYWKAARKYGLDKSLWDYTEVAVYGEIYGPVQDLHYNVPPNDIALAVFDMYDVANREWFDWDRVLKNCCILGLPTVPVLYRGPYRKDMIEQLVDGESTLGGNIREGIVIKSTSNRYVEELFGRLILKKKSIFYNLRRGSGKSEPTELK